MKLYVVKRITPTSESIKTGVLPFESALAVAATFNRDYQTDEYVVEEWDSEAFAKGLKLAWD